MAAIKCNHPGGIHLPRYVQDGPEYNLRKGVNTLDDAYWQQCKAHPNIAMYLEKGLLEETAAAEEVVTTEKADAEEVVESKRRGR